ncbi:MAG TPA: hypothetical protein VMC03_22400 [Streptosporangiaceae bacterium]|nr:hypothetical protein [Streptosporangiaceae bacterium]
MIDDSVGPGAEGMRFLEVRGNAEQVAAAEPAQPGLSPHLIRIHPRRVVSWNIDPQRPGMQAADVETS